MKNFKDILNTLQVKQILGLFSVNILSIPLGIITSILVTRYLGAQLYGDYKFISSIFSFAILVITFGFYQAGNRAIVLSNEEKKTQEYFGAELIISIALFVLMSIGLVIYAFFDSNIAEKGLVKILLYTIPFGGIYLIQRLLETTLLACNKIKILGLIRFLPKIGYLLFSLLAYFYLIGDHINKLLVILFVYLLTQAIVYLWALYQLRVKFSNFKLRFSEIWEYNKSFGFNVYVGSLFAVGFNALTEVLISYFGIDNTGVGYYSLALHFATPLAFIPNTIATTHYKKFASQTKISSKLIWITIVFCAFALIGLRLILSPFISYFYGEDFLPVIPICMVASFGVLIYGMADFFNRYLGANGQGKALRNASFIVGGSLLLMNLFLIPKYGAYGAAYTKVIAGGVYLVNMLFYYFKYIRMNKNNG